MLCRNCRRRRSRLALPRRSSMKVLEGVEFDRTRVGGGEGAPEGYVVGTHEGQGGHGGEDGTEGGTRAKGVVWCGAGSQPLQHVEDLVGRKQPQESGGVVEGRGGGGRERQGGHYDFDATHGTTTTTTFRGRRHFV